jgi:hypothetical protein
MRMMMMNLPVSACERPERERVYAPRLLLYYSNNYYDYNLLAILINDYYFVA